jgi:hypothetical protein
MSNHLVLISVFSKIQQRDPLEENLPPIHMSLAPHLPKIPCINQSHIPTSRHEEQKPT